MITFLAHRIRACAALVIAVSCLAVSAPLRGSGECVGLLPCEYLKRSTIVIVADVTSAGQPAVRIDDRTAHSIPQRVQLKVIERFKGVSSDQDELEASIAIRGAETVFLAPGRRYLIYARMREDGTWDTACSGTRPIEEAAADLEHLRRCRLPAREMRAAAQPELTDTDTYAVYSAVIEQSTRHRQNPVLISDVTQSGAGFCVPTVEPALSTWKEAAADFLQRSGSRLKLLPRLQIHSTSYRIVSPADLRTLVGERTGTEIVRYLRFSAVGFDATRTRAMVQRDHACANAVDCADGQTLLLEKQAGEWRVVYPKGVKVCGWIS